ncbi:MAG: 4-alpha-glucanotransferase [Bacteroidota bacterium]
MKITFRIQYFTRWGERLRLAGDVPALGKMNEENAADMTLVSPDSGIWELTADVRRKLPITFKYRYFVEDENTGKRTYECDDRLMRVGCRECNNVDIFDSWRSAPDPENTLFTSAFTDGLLRPENFTGENIMDFSMQEEDEYYIRFQIHVARVEPGHRLGVTGNCNALGNWEPEKGIEMFNDDHPQWRANIRLKKKDFPVYYKYFIYDQHTKEVLFMEDGRDRMLQFNQVNKKKKLFIKGDERFNFPRAPWKGAGVSIPVFSLRREKGYGVGEFTDIKMLVDWAKATGNKLIQLLPVNDTVATHTWTDSYPYAAISVYALHPIYANIEEMGSLRSETANRIVRERGQHLNVDKTIDYEGVMQLKSRYFKMLYDEQKKVFLEDPDFLKFFRKNEYWLKPYAAFSYLRDLFNTPNFSRWGKYKNFNPEIVDEITDINSDHYDDIAIHYFIQYHLHKQLLDSAEYARRQGVILKGDIPIGIYRNSVDAWVQPELYHMDKQAGAPPDDFSIKGQNWGFPTYNWEEMAKDGFKWWKNRLHKLSEYFDSFRIDHILGFFRIWEIPWESVDGIMGYFNPSLAFHRDELAQRGIYIDEKRFCEPYIREHFLVDRFGDLTDTVKELYLEETSPGEYRLKPEVATQRQIKEMFTPEPSDDSDLKRRKERIRDGLMSLAAEVLFLKNPYDPHQSSYFPRSTLHFTNSFRELDGHVQEAINEVYLDYFYRRNEEFWKQQAYFKLPAIKKATNMLICGEDLGMVPASVPEVMQNLGILSLEIQRMPKDPKKEFNHPADYPYLSVASPSSHDMPTIRGWWEENPGRSQRFYNTILGNEGNSPFYCEPWVVKQILDQHFFSPSMWAVIPIQDLMGADGTIRRQNPHEERINVPSNPNHYWRYRLHKTLEEMLELKDFNKMVYKWVKDSGRLKAY